MRRGALLVAAVIAWGPAQARAEEPPRSKAAETPLPPPPPGTVLKPRPAEPQKAPPRLEPSLDFDLLGAPPAALKPRAADPELEARVRRRRRMLLVHQAFGLTTLGALAATTVVGQLNLNDKYRGGGDTGRYQGLHKGLAFTTAGLFAVTGSLALFAPVPYARHRGFDTATVHKIAMGTATLGMLAQIVLGVQAHAREGHLDQRSFATAHQVVGYATLGAMTVGAVSFVF